jgi:hypothetical protein
MVEPQFLLFSFASSKDSENFVNWFSNKKSVLGPWNVFVNWSRSKHRGKQENGYLFAEQRMTKLEPTDASFDVTKLHVAEYDTSR